MVCVRVRVRVRVRVKVRVMVMVRIRANEPMFAKQTHSSHTQRKINV